MANYCCTVRTNYFRVKDPDAFRTGMKRVAGSEDCVYLWEEYDDGIYRFGFGCYGGIYGMRNDENDDEYDEDDLAYDAFIDFLQNNVADDDAILIFESGNEKLRYVVGEVTIITNNACEYHNIQRIGRDAARTLLGNSTWKTKTDY